MNRHRIFPLSLVVVCSLAVPLAACGAGPCCSITNIDANGTVSARENGNARVFQFRVADKALLESLHVGQPISADFGAQKVSIANLAPCCSIVSQPAAQSAAAPAAQPMAPCCNIAANPALTGRLGRLVVAFPEGAKVDRTNVKVFKANEQNDVANGYGSQTFDLLPGAYAVTVNGKRVEGVTVQSGHDTQLKVGVVRVGAGDRTNVKVLDSDQKLELTNGYGQQDLGFPAGTVYVSVAGQSEAVNVTEGKITDF